MNNEEIKKVTNFLYEVGSLRMIPRGHRQSLGIDDVADNIASHSHRVSVIGYLLAKMEGANPDRVALMCILHDVPETRSGDQNWIHKRYVSVDERKIAEDQYSGNIFSDFLKIHDEYNKRESIESKVAKDADMIDQLLLLKEYEWRGHKEATVWINGKGKSTGHKDRNKLSTESAKILLDNILNTNPGEWWENCYSSKRNA